MRKSEVLTPCPTCGHPPYGEIRGYNEAYRYKCCLNITPWFDNLDQAAALWESLVAMIPENQRVKEPKGESTWLITEDSDPKPPV
jgi:hypothetical protein